MGRWVTKNGAHIYIPDEDEILEQEKTKEKQIEANKKEGEAKNAEAKDEWRLKDEKFQKKTDGGVYFYSSPNSVYGKDIDEKMYDKLPKYIKKSVVQLESRKTGDGNHCEIYYVDKNGKIQWYDEYGMGDFMYGLKSTGKDEFGTVSDWNYDGQYKEGKQLSKKG